MSKENRVVDIIFGDMLILVLHMFTYLMHFLYVLAVQVQTVKSVSVLAKQYKYFGALLFVFPNSERNLM